MLVDFLNAYIVPLSLIISFPPLVFSWVWTEQDQNTYDEAVDEDLEEALRDE